jgi:hypothetical protein
MSDAPPHPAAARAAEPHLAGSLVSLKAGIDRHWPGRDKRSDGFIGDERHQAEGKGSDHNPWLLNTIRAGDFTTTQTHPEPVHGVDGAWLAEQLRLLGASGDPRLAGGGYVIYNGHITSPDFTRWLAYDGDPHTTHVHVSVSRDPGGFEYSGPWQFLAVAPLHPGPAHRPSPAPQHAATVPPALDHQVPASVGPHAGNTAHEAPAGVADLDGPEPSGYPGAGSDATGTGHDFRAQYGNDGPNVKRLQGELNRDLPTYSALTEDGLYGPETAAVLQDFARRVAADPHCPAEYRDALSRAHGDNVGPALAAVFPLYGIHV